MAGAHQSTRGVRFGLFTIDLLAREIRKKGRRVKTQKQPYEVLETLLEQPGTVVTHEELRQRLWPEDTFVDFDHSLRTSILKLREILGDSATRPRYIETVPRRGYRFIAPVEFIDTHRDWKLENSPRDANLGSAAAQGRRRAAFAAAILIAGLGIVVALSFNGIRHRFFGQPRFRIDSLAVLPFANGERNDVQIANLSDGLTGTLVDQLAQVPGLQVMGLSTVLHHPSSRVDSRRTGRELNVDAIVTGRLRRWGEHLIVSAEMVDVARGTRIWGGRFSRNVSDLANAQEEIARAISQGIGRKLARKGDNANIHHYPPNTRAYELYLKSRASAWALNLDDLPMSLRYARMAVQEDPNFALAYAALADIYATMGEFDLQLPTEAFPKARAAALKALEIDNTLPGPHAVLALVRLNFDWDWAGAEREIQHTLNLAPNRGDFHGLKVRFLIAMGRTGEAVAEAQRALELDPLIQRQVLVMAYVHARRYDDAIREAERVQEYKPNTLCANLAYCYLQKGAYDKLFEVLDKHSEVFDLNAEDVPPAREAFQKGGRQAFLDWVAEHFEEELGRGKALDVFTLASINAQANHKDAAFHWLEEAYKQHSYTMLTLQTWPAWDSLRSDSRFGDLLQRVHFPPKEHQFQIIRTRE